MSYLVCLPITHVGKHGQNGRREGGRARKGTVIYPHRRRLLRVSTPLTRQPVSTDDLAGFIHGHGNGWSAVLEGDVHLIEVPIGAHAVTG